MKILWRGTFCNARHRKGDLPHVQRFDTGREKPYFNASDAARAAQKLDDDLHREALRKEAARRQLSLSF